MPTPGINSCPSPMSKPRTPFPRTHGSRNRGQRPRPQRARWEFRRRDGAFPLKAADAPAERQTQHGIAETRFDNSQLPREPHLACQCPGRVCRGSARQPVLLGQAAGLGHLAKGVGGIQCGRRGCSVRQPAAFPKVPSSVESMEFKCERQLAVGRAQPQRWSGAPSPEAISGARACAPARASGPS